MNTIIKILILAFVMSLSVTQAFADDTDKAYLISWFQKNASKILAIAHPSATFKKASHVTVLNTTDEGAVYELKGKLHFVGGLSGSEYTVNVEYYVNDKRQFVAGKWEDDTAPFAPGGSPLDIFTVIAQETDAKLSKYYGKYTFEKENLTGQAVISSGANGTGVDAVKVSITTSSPNGCVGDIEAIGIVTADNQIECFEENSPATVFTLKFKDKDTILVKETPDSKKYHGDNCGFGGLYERE